MELQDYFKPINPAVVDFHGSPFRPMFGGCVDAYLPGGEFPDWRQSRLAMLGIEEDRASVDGQGSAPAPDFIRRKLYPLARPAAALRLADLGNITPGENVRDTYAAVTEVMARLIDNGLTVVVLGGSEDLMFPIYKAYEAAGRVINIASIDSRFNLEGGEAVTSNNYLQHIILQQPSHLFDFTNLGFQTYFVGREMIKLMDDLKFGAHRVGELQQNIELAEPLLRYADVVGIDISAVRQSDAPAASSTSPHGFYGEELCQMARYAGMSDKASCFAMFEMVPAHDHDEQTAHMMAHALWFFFEGFCYRIGDFPSGDRQNYKRFSVIMESGGTELVFYKSLKTDRWWMEVPCDDPERRSRFMRHTLVPCSYSDYEHAMNNDIPPLWWHFYNRFNR